MALGIGVTALGAQTASAVGTLTAKPDEVVFPTPPSWSESSALVTMSNDGPDAVTLGEVFLEGEDVEAFDFAGGSCLPGEALAAGATCTVDLVFTPLWWLGAGEQHDGTLVVEGGEDDEPAVVQLYASYRDPYPPRLMPQSSLLTLRAAPGTQGTPVEVVMRNTGELGLSFLSVTLDAAFPIVSNGCTGWLVPNGSCSVAIAYAPPVGASSTAVLGTLRFRTDPSSANFNVRLNGRLPVTRVPWVPRPLLGPQRKRPLRAFPWLDATLADLTDAVPRLIRGGPTRARVLPAFTAPVAGKLSLTLIGWNRTHRLGIGGGTLKFGPFGKAKSNRLSFRLNRRGVELLRRPQRSRIKVVLKFDPRNGAVSRQGPEFIVKAPATTRKRR